MKNKLPFPENLHADLVKRTYMNPSEMTWIQRMYFCSITRNRRL